MSCQVVAHCVCYVCYAWMPLGAWGMSAQKISKCQKRVCVVLFYGPENTLSDALLKTHTDTNFTWGNLMRSDHHFLYGFVPNIEQRLIKFAWLRVHELVDGKWTTRCSLHTLSRPLVKVCVRVTVLPYFSLRSVPPSMSCPLWHNWASDTLHPHPADCPPLLKHWKVLCVSVYINIVFKTRQIRAQGWLPRKNG